MIEPYFTNCFHPLFSLKLLFWPETPPKAKEFHSNKEMMAKSVDPFTIYISCNFLIFLKKLEEV